MTFLANNINYNNNNNNNATKNKSINIKCSAIRARDTHCARTHTSLMAQALDVVDSRDISAARARRDR